MLRASGALRDDEQTRSQVASAWSAGRKEVTSKLTEADRGGRGAYLLPRGAACFKVCSGFDFGF